MKKTMKLLSILLGIAGIGMLFLAGAVQLNIVLYLGIAMLIVAAALALVIALIKGDSGDDIGSYRMPRI